VGRFLEHSRIYYFQNGGAEELYLGSADLMHRNLSHRVEIIFPVESPRWVRRLKEILDIYLSDQAKARHLKSDGSYTRSTIQEGAFAVNAQTSFIGLTPQEDSSQATSAPL